jgi:chromatin remodeling complex protein RSC6
MPPKKSTTPKVEVAKPAEVVVEVKVETPVAAPEVGELTTAFNDFTAKMVALRSQMSGVISDFKALQKRTEKDVKAAQKANRRKKNANRQPSGFVKPTLISDQLADFLSKPKGTMIARTEVTRHINTYIRENKLQDEKNGRKINPDGKLKKLLTLKATDELTYFNLQRYMSQHFQKAAAAAPAAV